MRARLEPMKRRIFLLIFTAWFTAVSVHAAVTECVFRAGLPNVFGKLARGETVRIAYLGGSITGAILLVGEWVE